MSESIWEDLQKIVKTKADSFRTTMDSNIHCMDVGIAALKASDPSITYAEKEKLHRLFRKEFFLSSSLEEAILYCRDKSNIDRSLFVEDPALGDYIVSPSYGALRTRVTSALKFSKVESAFTGIDEVTGKTTTNIGHLSLKDSIAATTPLETKLIAILTALQKAPIASAMVSSKIKKLQKLHKLDTNYAFNRPNFDINKLQQVLGSSTVFVTLQTRIKNSALATLETEIEKDVREYLTSDKFHTKFINNKGSNSIVEDIYKGIEATLLGKKIVPGSLHTKKPISKSTNKLVDKPIISATRLPQIRNVKGRFYSLANLQVLLNTHLQDVISANMGNGSDKSVLNYRTGRFAASPQVERMSQSRDGAILAYYSYMKNPYATFSDGGRQSTPKSRDPKLLISKSIHEIAATMVGNKLRAIAL